MALAGPPAEQTVELREWEAKTRRGQTVLSSASLRHAPTLSCKSAVNTAGSASKAPALERHCGAALLNSTQPRVLRVETHARPPSHHYHHHSASTTQLHHLLTRLTT